MNVCIQMCMMCLCINVCEYACKSIYVVHTHLMSAHMYMHDMCGVLVLYMWIYT